MSLKTLIFAAAGLAIATPVMAQVEGLTLSSITVTRHETLTNLDPDMAMPCCATHVFESGADEDFIYIDADFAVAWSDELDRINIGSRFITLQLPNETDARQAWGRVDFFPEVERGGTSLNARRPRDFPDENAGAYLNLMFAVPSGATTAVLSIGEGSDSIQIPVDLTPEQSVFPAAASLYDIKVNGISTTTELTTEDRLSREEIAGRLTATAGEIVRIEVEVVPAMNADTDSEPGENQVFFRNTAFGLVGPEGLALVPIGRAVSGSIRNNYSNSASWDDDDDGGPTIDLTLFFLGSGAAGEYTLYFYDTPVANVPLQ